MASLAMKAIEIKRDSELNKGNYVVTISKHYFELKYEMLPNDVNDIYRIKVDNIYT